MTGSTLADITEGELISLLNRIQCAVEKSDIGMTALKGTRMMSLNEQGMKVRDATCFEIYLTVLRALLQLPVGGTVRDETHGEPHSTDIYAPFA